MTGNTAWAVYLVPVKGQDARHAVCSMDEWRALEVDRPGRHTLVASFVGSEGQAEAYARGRQTPPESLARNAKRVSIFSRSLDQLPSRYSRVTNPTAS